MSPFPRDVLLIPSERSLHPADRDTFKQSAATPRRHLRHRSRRRRRRRRHKLSRNVELEKTKGSHCETNKTFTNTDALSTSPIMLNVTSTKEQANCLMLVFHQTN